jgi:hypothetical protein
MRYKFITILFFLLSSKLIYSQAKKPIIMVVPSKAWCDNYGYVNRYNNQGIEQVEPDYEKAFLKNSELKLVISKINGIMAERGYPLKDLENTISNLKLTNAENAVITSKNGSEITESTLDKLKNIAKADIILELTWTINQRGPFKSVTFILRGLDSYTNKQIANAEGTSPENAAANLPILLETAVLSHIDNFNSTLQTYFDELFANGREITLSLKKFDSWDGDFEKEYNNKELGVIIENWLYENTINGKFNTIDATESMLNFEQVRIPMFDKNNRAQDARSYCRNLQNFLKSPPYNLTSKIITRGLGQVTLIIGDK